MGSLNVAKLSGKKAKANYFHHLIRDLQALDQMISEGLIEKEPIRIGAEQEFCITDSDFLPNSNALELLKAIDDPHFTTEIGDFNLEVNLDPLLFRGDCFDRLHDDLKKYLSLASQNAADLNSKIVLAGILPTLNHSHIGNDHMVPMARYAVLNEALKESKGQDFSIHIKGIDELNLLHDSVMLEGCNTSWQMHLQIDPDNFIEDFNWAQAISGPVLAACCNSPLLFGKELWQETRIAVFTQSVDVRAHSYFLNESQSRVSFEDHWYNSQISDIFKGNISRFRSLVTTEFEKDSMYMLSQGEIPKLKALSLHNGTVYRWNRACYGVGGGKPHLRIENRYIPAGPTPIDQVANFAFWAGLMCGRNEKYADISKKMDFKDVRDNFFRAARYGKATQFVWDGRQISSEKLLLDIFLPMAKVGLEKMEVNPASISNYLKIIEDRINGRNGAEWMISSYRNLQEKKKKNEAVQVLTAQLYLHQQENIPVSEWDVLSANCQTTFNLKRTVAHSMNTHVFTVESNDPLELVLNLMKWNGIHHLPVVEGDQNLIGLLSWSDVEKYLESKETIDFTVKDLMQTSIVTITPEKALNEAKVLMDLHNFHCLPVVKGNKLIGILTSNDFKSMEK